MRLVTFTQNERTQIGELVEDKIYGSGWPDSMISMIKRGITPDRLGKAINIADVKLEAPLRPGKIIAIGRNYTEHAQELGNDLPAAPLIFAKFPSTVIGPGENITWSSEVTTQVDWEVELGVIIRKRARNISEADALSYVFGYTIANDVSARDLQLRTDGQWTRGKSLDTFCPLGPCIVMTDELSDPQNLNLKTTVNGDVVQDSNTKNMIFKVPQLISYCSKMFTLEPGDVILTGTPSGVGEGMKPPRYLQDGDSVTVSVEGIGDLTNPCKMV